jgi:RNA polymerase sigma-70 factor (ECF subfamily)
MKPSSFRSDDELLKELRQGNEKAFIEIYEKFWYKIFLIAYQRLHKKELAQELVQNLFLKIWEKRLSLQIRNIEGYLFVSIKHAIIDHINAELALNNYHEYCSIFSTVKEETTEKMVAFDEVSNALEEGLNRLPEKSQQVFRLSRLSNWPIDKIARHMDLSEKTVQYHLTRSIKFLRTYLKEFTFSVLLALFG